MTLLFRQLLSGSGDLLLQTLLFGKVSPTVIPERFQFVETSADLFQFAFLGFILSPGIFAGDGKVIRM